MAARTNATPPDDVANDDGREERTGVQSIARAFAIMEAIADHRDGVGLAELSKRVDLHSSTTFHIVRTMVQLGYVSQDRDSKRYRLGRPLYQLAAGTTDEVWLAQTSKRVVDRLAEATGETAHFAVPSRDAVVILSKTQGTSAFQLSDNMGAVRPTHATAIGKVMLAHLEPDRLARRLGEAPLERFTPATITDPARLTSELEIVRQEGIAFDDAEYHAELRCAAVPVFGMTGALVGAIGISGAVWRLSLSALQAKVPTLYEFAGELSRELGQRDG